MFQFDGWSIKAVIVFVVVGGMVRVSSVMTGCGLVVVSLEVALTYIIKWGKCMSPCVVSMTTLLFLMKCNPIIGPVIFFITTKCSANELSPISNFSLAVDDGFSNWPLATCIWKLGGSSIWECFWGLSVWLFPSHPWQLHWQMLLSPPEHLRLIFLKMQRHIEHFLLSFQDYCRC